MKRTQAILVLVLVFTAGIVVGVVATRLVVRRVIANAIERPDKVRERLESLLSYRLDLDAEQRRLLGDELVRSQTRIQELRKEFQPRFEAILSELGTNLAPHLSAEQREKLERLRRDRSLLAP